MHLLRVRHIVVDIGAADVERLLVYAFGGAARDGLRLVPLLDRKEQLIRCRDDRGLCPFFDREVVETIASARHGQVEIVVFALCIFDKAGSVVGRDRRLGRRVQYHSDTVHLDGIFAHDRRFQLVRLFVRRKCRGVDLAQQCGLRKAERVKVEVCRHIAHMRIDRLTVHVERERFLRQLVEIEQHILRQIFEFLLAVDIEIDLFAQPCVALLGVEIFFERVEIGGESDCLADGEFVSIYAFNQHRVVFLYLPCQYYAPVNEHLGVLFARILGVAYADDILFRRRVALVLKHDLGPALVEVQLQVIAHQIARIDIKVRGRDAVAGEDLDLVRAALEREQILLLDRQHVPVRTELCVVVIARPDVDQLAVDGDLIVVAVLCRVAPRVRVAESDDDVAAVRLVIAKQARAAADRYRFRGVFGDEHELPDDRTVLKDQLDGHGRIAVVLRKRRRIDDDLAVLIRPNRLAARGSDRRRRGRDGDLGPAAERRRKERDRCRGFFDAVDAECLDRAVRQRDIIHLVLTGVERGKRALVQHDAAVFKPPLARGKISSHRTRDRSRLAVGIDIHGDRAAAGIVIVLEIGDDGHVLERRRGRRRPIDDRIGLRIDADDGDRSRLGLPSRRDRGDGDHERAVVCDRVLRCGSRSVDDSRAALLVDDRDLIAACEQHLVPTHDAGDLVVFELWRRRRQKRAADKERRCQQDDRDRRHDRHKRFLHTNIISYRARVGKCARLTVGMCEFDLKIRTATAVREVIRSARHAERRRRCFARAPARRRSRRPQAKRSIPLSREAWAGSACLRRRIAGICGTQL